MVCRAACGPATDLHMCRSAGRRMRRPELTCHMWHVTGAHMWAPAWRYMYRQEQRRLRKTFGAMRTVFKPPSGGGSPRRRTRSSNSLIEVGGFDSRRGLYTTDSEFGAVDFWRQPRFVNGPLRRVVCVVAGGSTPHRGTTLQARGFRVVVVGSAPTPVRERPASAGRLRCGVAGSALARALRFQYVISECVVLRQLRFVSGPPCAGRLRSWLASYPPGYA
jgi:hypothetical protein